MARCSDNNSSSNSSTRPSKVPPPASRTPLFSPRRWAKRCSCRQGRIAAQPARRRGSRSWQDLIAPPPISGFNEPGHHPHRHPRFRPDEQDSHEMSRPMPAARLGSKVSRTDSGAGYRPNTCQTCQTPKMMHRSQIWATEQVNGVPRAAQQMRPLGTIPRNPRVIPECHGKAQRLKSAGQSWILGRSGDTLSTTLTPPGEF